MSTQLMKSSDESRQKKNEYLIKKCSIFDVKQSGELVNAIVDVAEAGGRILLDTSLERVRDQIEDKISKLDLSEAKSSINCSTCNQSFSSREEQIEHFKCDFHLFNIKQKLKGKPIVSSEEFENLSEISSISGCDSDEEKEEDFVSSSDDENTNQIKTQVKGSPKVVFRLKDSTLLTMMKCTLHDKKNPPETGQELIKLAKSITSQDKWCVILVAAGHFAAAVFKGNEPILHKTFHRYVVRAKRGTVQSQHDSSGKFAKSAGANIRRQQEASFKDDIRMLLGTEWKTEVDACKCVFVRVPHYNRNILINVSNQKLAPFDKTDLRVRNVPFVTFRPTFNEVKRVHSLLSRIENYQPSYLDSQDTVKNETETVKSKSSKQPSESKPKSKAQPEKSVKESNRRVQEDPEELDSEEDDDDEVDGEELSSEFLSTNQVKSIDSDFITSLTGEDLKFFNEIYTSCMTNNAAKLSQLVQEFTTGDEKKQNLCESLLNKRLNKDNGFTLLHLTSQLGFADCVWSLMLNGADPSIPDLTRQNRMPYFLSANKPTRDQYRRFASDYPSRYDYVKARIDDPISADKLNERLEKEKEKKRKKNKQKKQKEAQMKEKSRQQEMELNERQRFLELTDQEKKKLILGRNFLNIMPVAGETATTAGATSGPVASNEFKIISRCWYCGVDNSSNVPFEYFDYKFCSTKCLKSHREQQQQKSSPSAKK